MPTVYACPLTPKPQYELASGVPNVGGQLFFYVAGSVNTKQNTYTDSTGSVANSNPVILNALGMPTTEIWLQSGLAYKCVYAPSTDTDPPTSPIWTIDGLRGINDVTGAVDQWVSFAGAPTYIGATSFSLVGDQTSTFQVGRRIKTTNTSGTVYSTISASVFGALTTVTVINDSTVLDAGLSAVSYGLISPTNTSLPALYSLKDVCDFRLTLTTGVPVTTADVTAAETLYFTPYRGNQIALYDGSSAWNVRASVEISIDIPDATNCYDVFCYDNAGVPTLEVLAWTNATTRATALTLQNGVLVKTGATTRRYVGTFYSTTAGNGQVEDSKAKRNLWNYYNRVRRPMQAALETANSWSYSTATVRQANANAANQLEYVQGVSEDAVEAAVVASYSNSSTGVQGASGIGVDVTNAFNNTDQLLGFAITAVASRDIPITSTYRGYPGVGRHLLTWCEWSEATGTGSFRGDHGTETVTQCGISGSIIG